MQVPAFVDLAMANRPVAKALSGATLDTFIGSILLSLGFAFQIAGQLGFWTSRNVGLFLIGLLAFSVGLYWIWLRRDLVNWLSNRVRAKWEMEEQDRAARRAAASA